MGGALLLIILLIAALTGQLQENSCDNSTTTETQLDSKSMTENAKNIYAHWKQKYGATPQAAAGILGVLQLESRLDPKSVNSSSGATGLAQWLGGRKDKLEDLAHKKTNQRPISGCSWIISTKNWTVVTMRQTSRFLNIRTCIKRPKPG